MVSLSNIKWKRNPNCKYKMSNPMKKIFNNLSTTKVSKNYNLYIPCSYNNIKKEIKDIDTSHPDQKIFIIDNADELCGKNALWNNLKNYYGIKEACKLMPNTYILSFQEDIKRFKKEYNPKNIYILKKNTQRQQGLQITRNYNKILNAYKDKYVVVQELLQNPYLINGRKINMRFYVLIVCNNNKINCYIHTNGFMYYTKDLFVKNSIKQEHNITTGYIDRKVYKTNPLTHNNFRTYLNNKGIDNNIVFNRIYNLIRKVVISTKNKICIESKLQQFMRFQLFGADIALDENLLPQIMEINKGPNMESMDKNDEDLKQGVLQDIFKVIQINNDNNHNFIKVF